MDFTDIGIWSGGHYALKIWWNELGNRDMSGKSAACCSRSCSCVDLDGGIIKSHATLAVKARGNAFFSLGGIDYWEIMGPVGNARN